MHERVAKSIIVFTIPQYVHMIMTIDDVSIFFLYEEPASRYVRTSLTWQRLRLYHVGTT